MKVDEKQSQFFRRHTTLIKKSDNQLDKFNIDIGNFTKKCLTMSFMRDLVYPLELVTAAKQKTNTIQYKHNPVEKALFTNTMTKKTSCKKDEIKKFANDLLNFASNKQLKLQETKSINYETLPSFVIKEDFFVLEQNSKTRDHMEDYLVIKKNYLNDQNKYMYVLCDGHSGDQVAKIVIDRLPIIYGETLKETNFNVDQSLTDSFRIMDEELTQYEETGSTCCLAYICIEDKQRVLYSANVGDSRTILIRNKEAIRISYDHKANDKTEMKRVKQEGGLIIRGRLYGTLAITRALGDYSFKIDVNGLINVPYVTRTLLEDTDKYIITASDGVWDVINEEKALELISKSDSDCSAGISKKFVLSAMELGSKDNISCIVTKLN